MLAVLVLGGIFTALLWPSREQLREEMQHTLIARDAAVLWPVVQSRLAEHPVNAPFEDENLRAILRSGEKAGTLAMAVFDANGTLVQAVPALQAFVDLAPADYLELTQLKPISRFHADFQLHSSFGVDDTLQPGVPVLEVLLPLQRTGSRRLDGIAQYWIDGRGLERELALIDERLKRETYATLGAGFALIAVVIGLATWRLGHAQREIAERNERLMRANLELSLSAKASVLGQITSHLLHGLQTPVAGLRAVMAARERSDSSEDWQTAADYTARLQQMIHQTVTMLTEQQAQISYEVTAVEFSALLHERHRAAAAQRGVTLIFESPAHDGFLASHRGNLLALVVGNLIENAIDASPPGEAVRIAIGVERGQWQVTVSDSGRGLPPQVRDALFEPGRTTKTGGTGLGLAISHLLARQIGAELQLRSTGESGTTFAVIVPPDGAADRAPA